MSNILIINGAKKFAHSNGQLNDTLTEVADGTLRDLGHDVRIVRADSDYDVKAEVQNFLWADVVIWQMPGWWMGAPWTVKNTLMMYSPKVTGRCMPAMVVPAKIRRKIRFRRPGTGQKIYAFSDRTHQWKPSPKKISSSTALALTVCICRSIKQTNSSVWNRCRHLSLMT